MASDIIGKPCKVRQLKRLASGCCQMTVVNGLLQANSWTRRTGQIAQADRSYDRQPSAEPSCGESPTAVRAGVRVRPAARVYRRPCRNKASACRLARVTRLVRAAEDGPLGGDDHGARAAGLAVDAVDEGEAAQQEGPHRPPRPCAIPRQRALLQPAPGRAAAAGRAPGGSPLSCRSSVSERRTPGGLVQVCNAAVSLRLLHGQGGAGHRRRLGGAGGADPVPVGASGAATRGRVDPSWGKRKQVSVPPRLRLGRT